MLYGYVLPLQTSAPVDCTSHSEEPSRQTCDAFLEIGPSHNIFLMSSGPQFSGIYMFCETPCPDINRFPTFPAATWFRHLSSFLDSNDYTENLILSLVHDAHPVTAIHNR